MVELNTRRFHIDKYLQQASNRKYKHRQTVEVGTSNTYRRVLEIFFFLFSNFTPPSAAIRIISAWRLWWCISTHHQCPPQHLSPRVRERKGKAKRQKFLETYRNIHSTLPADREHPKDPCSISSHIWQLPRHNICFMVRMHHLRIWVESHLISSVYCLSLFLYLRITWTCLFFFPCTQRATQIHTCLLKKTKQTTIAAMVQTQFPSSPSQPNLLAG